MAQGLEADLCCTHSSSFDVETSGHAIPWALDHGKRPQKYYAKCLYDFASTANCHQVHGDRFRPYPLYDGAFSNDQEHKISKALIDENQAIFAKDINVHGMVKNHHLAKAVNDVAFNSLMLKLAYKAQWYGRVFLRVDRYFPSMQLCPHCGYCILSLREWRASRVGNGNASSAMRATTEIWLPPLISFTKKCGWDRSVATCALGMGTLRS